MLSPGCLCRNRIEENSHDLGHYLRVGMCSNVDHSHHSGYMEEFAEVTAKEYLQQLHQIDTEIEIKRQELMQLRASIGIKAMPDPELNAGRSDWPSDPVSEIVLKIVKMEEQIERKIKKLVALRNTITAQIDGMENRTYRNLLTCKYVLEMTWPQVAETMHYNEDYCKKELHGWALQTFYKMYLKKPTESPH